MTVLPPLALYPEDHAHMGARWNEHRVVQCNFCRRYAMGRRFCNYLPYGIAAGTWIAEACYPCREASRNA